MLSVQTGLNSQTAALSQTPSSPVGPALQEEEKKKQSHIPTVEVSAVQSQSVSARVGDFLANQTSKPSGATGGGAGAIAPTGADGAAPAAAAATDTPPPSASDDGGSSTDGEADQASIAYSLLRGDQAGEADANRNAGGPSETTGAEEDEAFADDDDLTYSASQQPTRSVLQDVPPVPPANAGTIVNTDQAALSANSLQNEETDTGDQGRREDRESVEETEDSSGSSAAGKGKPETSPSVAQVTSGDFSLYFDEAGTYQLAAA